jgi:glycosyltransferase involved in cell wall biosynthesis
MVSDDVLPAATGVGVHVQHVASELARRGHRVSVLTTRRKGEPALETWEGVRLHRVFTVKVYDFYQAVPSRATVRRILRDDRPDIVHHHYASMLMMRAASVACDLQVHQVSTYHFGAEVLTQPMPMRPFRALIRRAMVATNNRCDLVIAPSHSVAGQIAAMGIRTPIRTISNPIAFGDITGVVPAERDAGFTILYAGRLGPEKNLGYLLAAFEPLLETLPDAQLWLAGKGPMRDDLERQCALLGIGNRVTFLGFLDHDELARRYSACDAFVLPSLIEAQPMAVLEAMWFGKPSIVTDRIVSSREIVEDGVTGYVIDPTAPQNLTERLLDLAASDALRRDMGARARERVEGYRPEAIVDRLEEAYRSVLATTKAAG